MNITQQPALTLHDDLDNISLMKLLASPTTDTYNTFCPPRHMVTSHPAAPATQQQIGYLYHYPHPHPHPPPHLGCGRDFQRDFQTVARHVALPAQGYHQVASSPVQEYTLDSGQPRLGERLEVKFSPDSLHQTSAPPSDCVEVKVAPDTSSLVDESGARSRSGRGAAHSGGKISPRYTSHSLDSQTQ